jgi:hypothetical protein
VTGTRPERPALATLICIYETLIVVRTIASHYITRPLPPTLHNGLTVPLIHFTNPLQPAASWLTCALAVAATVTLWRMHRSAVVFLAGRFCISLVLFLVGFPRVQSLFATMHPPSPSINLSALLWVASAIAITGIALNAFIAWYAYDITTPEALSPPHPYDLCDVKLPPSAQDPASPPSQNQ